MPDYRSSTEEATTHRRAFAVHLQNPYGDPAGSGILFEEEDVLVIGDRTIKITTGNVGSGFMPGETFALLDPTTGAPTGATASHLDVYVLLNSLYIDLALKRDAAEAAADAPPPAP